MQTASEASSSVVSAGRQLNSWLLTCYLLVIFFVEMCSTLIWNLYGWLGDGSALVLETRIEQGDFSQTFMFDWIFEFLPALVCLFLVVLYIRMWKSASLGLGVKNRIGLGLLIFYNVYHILRILTLALPFVLPQDVFVNFYTSCGLGEGNLVSSHYNLMFCLQLAGVLFLVCPSRMSRWLKVMAVIFLIQNVISIVIVDVWVMAEGLEMTPQLMQERLTPLHFYITVILVVMLVIGIRRTRRKLSVEA